MTNVTKDYLLDYNSEIMYPYTTLDCILGSDEPGSESGAKAIVSSILDTAKNTYVYDPDEENVVNPQYIHTSDINGTNLSMIGMYNDGEKTSFIKMHQILPDESYSNYYLGTDGRNHYIGNGAPQDIEVKSGSLTKWLHGSVEFDHSECNIILNARLSQSYFGEDSQGNLKVITADSVTFAAKLYASVENQTPYVTNNNVLTYFVDGKPTKSAATIGSTNAPIYYDGENGFKQLSLDLPAIKGILHASITDITGTTYENGDYKYTYTVGTGDDAKTYGVNYDDTSGEQGVNEYKIPLLEIRNGVIGYAKNAKIGSMLINDYTYAMAVIDGYLQVNTRTVGSNRKFTYIDEGVFKTVDENIGWSSYEAEQGPAPIYYDRTEGFKTLSQSAIFAHLNRMAKATSGADQQDELTLLDCRLIMSPFNENGTKTNLDDNKTYVLTSSLSAPNVNGHPKWEPLQQSVTIEPVPIAQEEANNQPFYITGVRMATDDTGTTATTDNPTPTAPTTTEWLDINNNIASKLGVATSGYYDHASSIYFKGLKLFQTSDERLKTFVRDLKDIDVDRLANSKKGIYYWNSDKSQKLDIGVTAQSVEEIFPEIIDENEGLKSVSYNRLGVIALAAIDKLNQRIHELEEEIRQLKK
jgi:hypothetical protein